VKPRSCLLIIDLSKAFIKDANHPVIQGVAEIAPFFNIVVSADMNGLLFDFMIRKKKSPSEFNAFFHPSLLDKSHYLLNKTSSSCFTTPFNRFLKKQKISDLTICGAFLEDCIDRTLGGAFLFKAFHLDAIQSDQFKVTLLRDLCISGIEDGHRATNFENVRLPAYRARGLNVQNSSFYQQRVA
jgi:nicotinamidase-related amidase